MKKESLFIILTSVSTLLLAQQTSTKDQQDAKYTVVNFFEAISNHDSVSLKTYSTTDISLYEYGQVWNLDSLIKKAITMNKATDFKRTNTFDFIKTRTDKKTAWVTYRLSSAITKDGNQATVHWLETAILAKEKKRWKVKHLHSTLIKRS